MKQEFGKNSYKREDKTLISYISPLTSKRGITLIALIITIIAMLILVTVTIKIISHVDLFSYSGKAVKKTQEGINVEKALTNGRIKADNVWYDSFSDFIKNIPSSDQDSSTDDNDNNDDDTQPNVAVAAVTMEGEIFQFYDLKSAIEVAKENGLAVYLINDYELKEDLIIPENTQLIIGNGKVESYEPTNAVQTFGNLKVNSKITVNGKLYVLPWVETEDGKATKISDVKTRNITLGLNGSIVVAEGGEFKDCSKVSGAPMQVLDYIDYPYQYTNVTTQNPTDATQTATSNLQGWRVFLNYIDDNGNKLVKIITAGIPETITVTETDFEENNLDGPYTATVTFYTDKGYELKNLQEHGKKYYLSKYASSYSVLGFLDAYQKFTKGNCEDELVLNGGYYFVNVYSSTRGGMGYVSPEKNQNTSETGGTSGLRPVMTLKNDSAIYKLWDEANSRYYWKFAN